jgi:hypothetical protein
MRPLVIGLGSFVAGGLLVAGGFTAFPTKAAKVERGKPAPEAQPGTDDELRKANERLTESLHACDRKLAATKDQEPEHAPAASAAAPPPQERGPGRARRQGGRETTKEDWERMAELGVVRTRVPCIRDTPWGPSERVVNRLGLAPGDAQTITDAYERSNKRVMAEIKPLCAKVLGSPDAADAVGPSGCMDAIQNSARKADPKAAKESLSRVADINAGKKPAPKDNQGLAPLERLGMALTAESKAFEADLAQKLGPEEAKRLANSPELCADRRTLRASNERELPRDDR